MAALVELAALEVEWNRLKDVRGEAVVSKLLYDAHHGNVFVVVYNDVSVYVHRLQGRVRPRRGEEHFTVREEKFHDGVALTAEGGVLMVSGGCNINFFDAAKSVVVCTLGPGPLSSLCLCVLHEQQQLIVVFKGKEQSAKHMVRVYDTITWTVRQEFELDLGGFGHVSGYYLVGHAYRDVTTEIFLCIKHVPAGLAATTSLGAFSLPAMSSANSGLSSTITARVICTLPDTMSQFTRCGADSRYIAGMIRDSNRKHDVAVVDTSASRVSANNGMAPVVAQWRAPSDVDGLCWGDPGLLYVSRQARDTDLDPETYVVDEMVMIEMLPVLPVPWRAALAQRITPRALVARLRAVAGLRCGLGASSADSTVSSLWSNLPLEIFELVVAAMCDACLPGPVLLP